MENTVLEKRKIKIKPIFRRRAFLPKGHDGEHTYTGCNKEYCLPFNGKARSFVNPFLKDGEQEQFEKLLNLKEGALNLYDFKSKFWGDFSFRLTKEGDELNLENPTDALWYRVFLVSPKFANSPEVKHDPRCDFFLEDEAEQEIIESKKSIVKEEALDILYKIKKNKKTMYNTLRLLGKKPSKDASPEWLKNELFKIVEEEGGANKIGIHDFIKVSKDPLAETKLFVLDAVDAGEIKRKENGYWATDFNKYLGKRLEDAVIFFTEKDPDVLEMKQIIETRIKN